MRAALVAVAWSVLLPAAAAAQQPILDAEPPPARMVALRGTLTDSLVSGAPLAGAKVEIVGVAEAAISDEFGRFFFGSVEAGRRMVVYSHPVFDSLGLGAQVTEIVVPVLDTAYVTLATSSPAAVYQRVCGRPAPAEVGMMIGDVRHAGTDEPVVAAKVTASWTELVFGRRAVERVAMLREGVSDAAGRYAICGVASGVAISLMAQVGRDTTGVVESALSERGLGITRLLVLPTAVAAIGDTTPAAAPTAGLRGRVVDASGTPLHDARISVMGGSAVARSDQDGRFSLNGLPAGSSTLLALAIGYEPTRQTVHLRPDTAISALVAVGARVEVLPTVAVVARGTSNMAMFRVRERARAAGYFLGPEELARRFAFDVADFLAAVPGVRMDYRGGRAVAYGRPGSRGGNDCPLNWYVDGMAVPDFATPRDAVLPSEVAAIEVYVSSLTMPRQLARPGNNCGAVAVWTNRVMGPGEP